MQNSSKNLLKARNLIQIQKRETMSGNNETTPHKHAIIGSAKISTQTPIEDYKKLVSEKLQIDEIVPDEVLEDNFTKIATAARETVWKLLFDKESITEETKKKASDLLEAYKRDACFYAPTEYNKWVVTFRDELLKRKIVDFWRDHVVKRELGPCWARDSDFFDDLEDPEPRAFYNHAGCVAPFSDGEGSAPPTPSAAPTSPEVDPTSPTAARDAEIANFTAHISPETALHDYRKLMKERVLVDEYVDEEVLQDNYRKIATVMRQVIWHLLFPEQLPAQEVLATAATLLEEYKKDAAFHSPWEYNKWIVTVRDELLKRKMFEFWREHMVKHELGPCWAKDSDYFDDMEDPEPEAFYKHAGCVAPFSKESKKN